MSENRTKVKKKICTLLVGNCAKSIVWVCTPFKRNYEALILWSILEFLERILQSLGPNHEREVAMCWGVYDLEEKSFHVGCPPLIQPEVGCVCVAVER